MPKTITAVTQTAITETASVPVSGDVSSAARLETIIQNLLDNDKTLSGNKITITTGTGLDGADTATSSGAITLSVVDGGIDTAQLANGSVDTTKIDAVNAPSNANAWLRFINNQLIWTTLNIQIPNESVTEAKLDVSNAPAAGRFLQYKDGTDQLTWSTVAISPYIPTTQATLTLNTSRSTRQMSNSLMTNMKWFNFGGMTTMTGRVTIQSTHSRTANSQNNVRFDWGTDNRIKPSSTFGFQTGIVQQYKAPLNTNLRVYVEANTDYLEFYVTPSVAGLIPSTQYQFMISYPSAS